MVSLLRLYISLQPVPIKRFSAYFPMAIKRYKNQPSNKENNSHGMERAPTTAEEFERVAEEFERVAEAKARKTVEKVNDSTHEAVIGDSRVESVKDKEESVDKGYLHKKEGE